jgi:hypothetical protein
MEGFKQKGIENNQYFSFGEKVYSPTGGIIKDY